MATESGHVRALVVVFDALRPEFVKPDLMPNLDAFASGGARYTNSRSTFPSETRVNQSAVTTGCYPRKHGVVANNFVVSGGEGDVVLNTGDDVAFEAALNTMQGPLLGVPTLGQRLAAVGKTYATISAGTSGGGRLINIAASETGSFRFALRRPEAALPPGAEDALPQAVGPLPEYTLPALDWIDYAVNCYLGYVEPVVHPDVMLLWLCEPDESFHWRGIGSPDAIETMRNADAAFGRILAHHDEDIAAGRMQVIALSDHGQISVRGEPLGLASKFAEAGFEDPGLNIVVANGGGVWLRDPEPARIGEIVQWLQQQDWCGPVFTRDGLAGTLTHSHLFIDHPRAADVALALRCDESPNEWDCAGLSLHDSKYPTGCGCHGGLSVFEMHNFLALSGSQFKQALTLDMPAGNVDVMPTLLAVLGLEPPAGIDGRVLTEALSSTPESQVADAEETTHVSSNETGATTYLSTSRVGATPYINRAWVE